MSEDSAHRGGIDLGGTKIEAIVVDDGNTVLGPVAASDADRGRACRRRRPDVRGHAQAAADAAGVETVRAPRRRHRLARFGRRGRRDRHPGPQPARLGRHVRARQGALAVARDAGPRRQRRAGGDGAELELGAGGALFARCWACSGAPASAAASLIDGKLWLGRGAAGEIGHMVIKRDGAHCPCGRRGCVEAYAGRAAMEAKARKDHDDGAKTDLFKIMKQRGRTRLTSAVWAHALEHHDPLATELIDRAVEALGAGIASARQPARRRGRHHRRRPRRAIRPADDRPDHRGDAPRTCSAMTVRRTSTWPRSGDLGGAIGAALLAR